MNDNFKPSGFSDWYEQVSKELKGQVPEDKIYWGFDKQIKLPPLLDPTDTPPSGASQRRNANGNTWKKAEFFQSEYGSVRKLNKQILQALQSGMDSLYIRIPKWDRPESDTFKELLREIDLNLIDLQIESDGDMEGIVYRLLEYFLQAGFSPDKMQGSLLFDPFDIALQQGSWMQSAKDDLQRCVALQQKVRTEMPAFRAFAVDGYVYHKCGAESATELALTLAASHEMLVAHLDQGATDQVLNTPWQIVMGVDHRIIGSSSKLRAMRILWDNLLSNYSLKIPMHLCARSSNRFRSHYDRYNNLLRATAELYASVNGGADSIVMDAYPHTSEHDRRIFRNLHHLLEAEGRLHYTADPFGGAALPEKLTEELASESWELFKKIEAEGGLVSWIEKGKLQNRIKEEREKALELFDQRKTIVTGVNQFAQREAEPIIPQIEAFETHAADFERMGTFSLSEALELMRYENEQNQAIRPYLLLKFGHVPMSIARANFIADFLLCGGLPFEEKELPASEWESVNVNPYAGIILCSADEEYSVAVKTLKHLHPEIPILIAGAPVNSDALKQAGSLMFIHIKSSLSATLHQLKNLAS